MNNHQLTLIDSANVKVAKSKEYNYVFNKSSGLFIRWGKTKQDNPEMAPFPEILDIEVTTICNNACPFCYKGNSLKGKNMSFDTFKAILDKMEYQGVHFLTQIAFGADSNATSNPDLFHMMQYAREKGIIPNITVADISENTAIQLAKICGAVAVSRYADKNKCYNSVKLLTDNGLAQVNIHAILSKETLGQVWETIRDYQTDDRLGALNAIVILSLKKKGRGINHNPVSQEEFNKIVKFALENKIPLGFDSCSAGKFLAAVKDHPNFETFETLSEPCESTLFSAYINVDGEFFSCSFCEKHDSFVTGIKVLEQEDFVRDIWMGSATTKWREVLLARRASGDFGCPVFEV